MYVHRKLETSLKEALKQSPVIIVTGPRQAGKSTLLQKMAVGYTYITFDDILIRELAFQDPDLFLATYRPPLIIDEIQYVPSILSGIKRKVDQHRQKYGQYLLTGSQIFPLMKGISESLAGRAMIFQLYPLSFEEMTGPKEDALAVAKQVVRGFYPELYVNPHINTRFWLSSYLSTYIERDIRSMRNIHDLAQFQNFIILLAARVGALLNLNEVAKEAGISQTTAKDWLNLLVASSVVFLLPPYSRNITKRIVKTPKLYFVDTGLLCYLLRIENGEQLIHSPFGGHVFENMVVMEVVKQFAQKGERAPCYFYRTHNGIEVDLLLDFGSFFDAYEIKFSSTPKPSMITSLLQFRKEFPIKKSGLITLRPESVPLAEGISSIYWNMLHY